MKFNGNLPTPRQTLLLESNVPVMYYRDKATDRDHWYSFAVYEDGDWVLRWEPKLGVRVDFERRFFDLFLEDPWVYLGSDRVKVVDVSENPPRIVVGLF